MAKVNTKTNHIKNCIDKDESFASFLHLSENINWIDGIPSRVHGFTRKACPLSFGDNEIVDKLIIHALEKINIQQNSYRVYGIYLNYYRDGNDFTPSHSHQNTDQVVISLGATRELIIGKKSYKMESGDVIMFGSAVHGIPKDLNCTNGRISIAMFIGKNTS